MWVKNTRVFKRQKMEGLFTTAEQSSGCAILTHILFMALLFVPPPQIRKPLSKVFFAVFAVVLVSVGNRKKGQDHVPAKRCMKFILMQTIFTAYLDFCTKHGSAVFPFQFVSPLLENIPQQQTGFSLCLYLLLSFTIWRRHHVVVNTLISFTCLAVFRT